MPNLPERNQPGPLAAPGSSETPEKMHRESHRESQVGTENPRAEPAQAANDHFLASISHELRTPLSAMLLWIKLLEDERDSSPEHFREGLEAIRQCAGELQELIDDLVDTSRIVAGKIQLDLKPTNLVATARLAVEAVRPSAIAKNLSIAERLDPDVAWVTADSRRVQQVISNLLTNAVKFTPPGGRIAIEMARRGDIVEIRVMDSGIGIAADFIGRVFDRYGQAGQSANRESNGLGLGLSICKRLVELHGGTITAESAGTGQGATFVVSIPWRAIDPAVAPRPGTSSST